MSKKDIELYLKLVSSEDKKPIVGTVDTGPQDTI